MKASNKPRTLVLLLLAAALMFVFSIALAGSSLAALGGSNPHAHHAGVAQTDTYYDATTQSQPATIVHINVVDNAFSPKHLTVSVGTTVVWKNMGVHHHTVSGELFDTGDFRPGAVFTFTFTTAGFVPYQCDYHAVSDNMVADITVNPAPTDTPTPPTTPTAIPSTPTPQPTVCPNPFVDINTNPFFHAINALYCQGVINGNDATHYNPSGNSNRAEFAKLVVAGFAIPSYTPANPDFTDVPPGYFAYLYIESGFHAGILSGFDQNGCAVSHAQFPCYLPATQISRGQVTKLVVLAAHYTITTPATPSFTDVPPSHPFYPYIETAANKGVVNGFSDHTFRPDNPIQRDQMAQIVFMGINTP